MEDSVLGVQDLALILRYLFAGAALRHYQPVQLLLPIKAVFACMVCDSHRGHRVAGVAGILGEHRFTATLLERVEVACFHSDVAAAAIVQLSSRLCL